MVLRDGNTGQISLGDNTRRLTPGEAGFHEGGGIPGLSCGNCRYFVGAGVGGQQEAVCFLVEVHPDAEDVCDQFEPALSDGRIPSASGNTLQVMSTARLDMFITRADDKSGRRRWYATSSGVKRDAYGEYMTIDLFRDFVRRIRENQPAPEVFASKAWKGGAPYLGIAHYLDMEGFGIVGDAERVYIDGSTLKARGTFRSSPMADAAYDAIRRDIEDEAPVDRRVRISIAFVDFGHDHKGVGAFERKSLVDRCEMCERGVGEKYYKRGQLVHLALTRNPAYPETEIVAVAAPERAALQERSMSAKRDDAASIVGDGLADELEKKAKGLTERTASVDPRAMVVKAEDAAGSAPAAAQGEPMLAQPMGEMHSGTHEAHGYLGGAKSLSEADVFLARSGNPMVDSWGVLGAVLTNIAGAEKAPSIQSTLSEFRKDLDIQTASTLQAIAPLIAKGGNEVEKVPISPSPEPVAPAAPSADATPPAPAPEAAAPPAPAAPEPVVAAAAPHPLDAPLGAFRETYDRAMQSALSPDDRVALMQPAYDALGDAVMRSLAAVPEASAATGAPAPVVNSQEIAAIVSREVREQMVATVTPVVTEVRALVAALAQRAVAPALRQATPVTPVQPERRAVRLIPRSMSAWPNAVVPNFGEPPRKQSRLTALVRRSVGLQD